MFAVETYAAVRRFVFIEGKSRREAARVFGLSRDTISKMCRYSAPPGCRLAFAVVSLCCQMPDHPAFEGLIIEIDATDVIRNLDLVKALAGQLRFSNIAISIDDLGSEWPSLVGLHYFPFVEIKVDRQFIAGCADDGPISPA